MREGAQVHPSGRNLEDGRGWASGVEHRCVAALSVDRFLGANYVHQHPLAPETKGRPQGWCPQEEAKDHGSWLLEGQPMESWSLVPRAHLP